MARGYSRVAEYLPNVLQGLGSVSEPLLFLCLSSIPLCGTKVSGTMLASCPGLFSVAVVNTITKGNMGEEREAKGGT